MIVLFLKIGNMTFLISSIGSFLLFANYNLHTLVEMASWIFRSYSACSVSGTNTPLRLVISHSSAGVSRIVQILCLLVSLIILLNNSFSKCICILPICCSNFLFFFCFLDFLFMLDKFGNLLFD